MSGLTDGDLVARVLAGDRDAYAGLVQRHQERLYRYALGMVGSADDAADLVQDTLVRGYTRLASCDDPDRFAPWAFRILRNRCLDYLKDRRRQNVPLDPEAPFADEREDAELTLARGNVRRDLERALESLPEAQREAFLLKHVEGLSYEEMAEALDASVSALKMRVMRAREALQAQLQGAGLT